MEYAFHVQNQFAADGITMALSKLLLADFQRKYTLKRGAVKKSAPPVVVCVGSDLTIGDCLGPISGSMLKYKTQGTNAFLYGTLAAPVTAKEIAYMRTFLKETHPTSPVIAVDAAVGEAGDVGLIKVHDTPLMPGAGANKKLGALGDMSILGIVAEKSVANYALLNTTRLNLVYTMSEIISSALAALLWEQNRAGEKSNENIV